MKHRAFPASAKLRRVGLSAIVLAYRLRAAASIPNAVGKTIQPP